MSRFIFVLTFLLASAKALSLELSLSPGGFAFHTLKPEPEGLIELMPRKVDSNGHMVFTPGIGAIFRMDSSWQIAGIALSDSFSNPAGAVTVGYEWPLGESGFSYGAVAGLYARKSIEGCHRRNTSVICINKAKDLPVKFQVGGGASKTDFAPLLMGQLSYKVGLTENLALDFHFFTALYISLLNVGVRFPL